MKKFDALSLEARAGILWEGDHVITMDYYNFSLKLYILPNNRFAEVWYCNQQKQILEIILTEEGHMDKWLNRIRLNL